MLSLWTAVISYTREHSITESLPVIEWCKLLPCFCISFFLNFSFITYVKCFEPFMAQSDLLCADVPLRSYSFTRWVMLCVWLCVAVESAVTDTAVSVSGQSRPLFNVGDDNTTSSEQLSTSSAAEPEPAAADSSLLARDVSHADDNTPASPVVTAAASADDETKLSVVKSQPPSASDTTASVTTPAMHKSASKWVTHCHMISLSNVFCVF